MSRLIKSFIVATGLWVLLILGVFALPHPFPALTGFGILYFPLLGFVLLVFSVIALFKGKKKWIALLGMVSIMVISWAVFKKGFSWGARLNFHLNRSRYESILGKVMSAQTKEEKEETCGGSCWVMSEEENRVAFHYAHGFLNWHDIVYDPTGKVETNDFYRKKALDLYFVGAEKITDNWYVGHFAD